MMPALLVGHWDELVFAVTTRVWKLSAEVPRVVRALAADEVHPDVRYKAVSIVGAMSDLPIPRAEAIGTLVRRLALLADEGSVFPSPLHAPSATWMASGDVERQLRAAVERAVRVFKRNRAKQLAVDEGAHLDHLLTLLELELRSSMPTIWGLANGSRVLTGAVLSHRVNTKKEERTTGVDVALRVDLDIEGHLRLRAYELIQMKKPERDGSSSPFEWAWKVDIAQLRTILRKSSSAAYLFIDPEAGLFVLPAKFLLGLIQGSGRATQGSAQIEYNDVRSTAIALPQFLAPRVMAKIRVRLHPDPETELSDR